MEPLIYQCLFSQHASEELGQASLVVRGLVMRQRGNENEINGMKNVVIFSGCVLRIGFVVTL